jgi:hypothetical protein
MSHPSVETASAMIRNKIEATPGPLPPGFLVEVLLTAWRRHVALVHRDSGEDSPTWREAVDLTEAMLWSVAPKSDPESRKELQERLESLVQGVRKGLDHAGLTDDAQKAFLSELAEVHIARLNPERPGRYALTPAQESGADTITIDFRDPRYARLIEFLNGAEIENITL